MAPGLMGSTPHGGTRVTRPTAPGTVRGVIDVPLHDLRTAAGIGVAGNFAGHLEQAGEAADFVNVVADSAVAPKGSSRGTCRGAMGTSGQSP